MSLQGGKSSMGSTVESPASSCVSSDEDEAAAVAVAKPMMVVGCPQCLMYVMLSEEQEQPKCPRCKSPVLLHFLHGAADANNNKHQGSKS